MRSLTVYVKNKEAGVLSKFRDGTYEFVRGSFLTADAQTEYLRLFHDRLKMFR